MFLESMLEFAEIAEIKTDKMTVTCDEENNEVVLRKREIKGLNNTSERIIIEMDEKKNSVKINQEIREESQFEKLENEEYSYDVFGFQRIVEIQVNGEELELSAASLCQVIQEDTQTGGERFIVKFNTIADMIDPNINKWMKDGEDMIPVEKKKYIVPQGYKVIDGTSQIEETKSSEVFMSKRK